MIYYAVTETKTEVGFPAILETAWPVILETAEKNLFPNDIKNVFFETYLPKTKPITVGIIYWLPNQTNFIKTLNENFAKRDTTNKETYINVRFSMDFYHNGKYIICKKKKKPSSEISF